MKEPQHLLLLTSFFLFGGSSEAGWLEDILVYLLSRG